MLSILDYKAGNQTSVERALRYLGIPCQITANMETLASSEGIVFPGVGQASQAMTELSCSGLDQFLRSAVASHQPLLGICVGSQIVLEKSEEGSTRTLGIIKGQCKRFRDGLSQEDGTEAKIPHMGWNSLKVKKNDLILNGIEEDAEFYFVHSYYPEPQQDLVLATCYHGQEFCALFGREGLWCAQFHPEKSGRPGLKLLENFYKFCKGGRNAV